MWGRKMEGSKHKELAKLSTLHTLGQQQHIIWQKSGQVLVLILKSLEVGGGELLGLDSLLTAYTCQVMTDVCLQGAFRLWMSPQLLRKTWGKKERKIKKNTKLFFCIFVSINIQSRWETIRSNVYSLCSTWHFAALDLSLTRPHWLEHTAGLREISYSNIRLWSNFFWFKSPVLLCYFAFLYFVMYFVY